MPDKLKSGSRKPALLTQKDFCQKIVVTALAMCFGQPEEQLTIDQLVIRGFAPTETYCKSCVKALVDAELVETKIIEPIFPSDDASSILLIKCPVQSDAYSLAEFICNMSSEITQLVAHSFEYTLYLREFIQEVTCGECIEYADYYARRSDILIENASPHNPRLRLLVRECPIEKIQMLLWRAIKTLSKRCTADQRVVEFSALTETAFEFYIAYKKASHAIESYQRPKVLKPSILASILEIYIGTKANEFC